MGGQDGKKDDAPKSMDDILKSHKKTLAAAKAPKDSFLSPKSAQILEKVSRMESNSAVTALRMKVAQTALDRKPLNVFECCIL